MIMLYRTQGLNLQPEKPGERARAFEARGSHLRNSRTAAGAMGKYYTQTHIN